MYDKRRGELTLAFPENLLEAHCGQVNSADGTGMQNAWKTVHKAKIRGSKDSTKDITLHNYPQFFANSRDTVAAIKHIGLIRHIVIVVKLGPAKFHGRNQNI